MGKSSSRKRRRQQQERQDFDSQRSLQGGLPPISSTHKSQPTLKTEKRRASTADHAIGDPVETESRKRSRRQLEFVHPKENGRALPYIFRRQAANSNGTKTTIGPSVSPPGLANRTNAQNSDSNNSNSRESIDDIFSSRNNKATETNGEGSLTSVTTPTPSEYVSGGKLSGLSVDQALSDKFGCRPRANSTDGELNLPRRGLCDEHMVLQSHRWNASIQGRPPRGFVNLGNSCFLNSTLQCLAYLPPFCQSLLAMQERKSAENGKKMSQGKRITFFLRSLFQKVSTQGGAIEPRALVKALPSLGTCGGRYGGYQFRPGRQEDAHEFLVHLLDAMHDGELREAGINQQHSGWRDRLPIPRLDETTFVHRIFGGYLRSQLQCSRCKYCSNTYDPFFDLALEVSGKSIRSVSDAFQEFTREETLDSDNRWKCGGCGHHVRAKKALTVFRPPLTLCVQMKRFSFGGFGGFSSGFGLNFKKKFGGGRGNKISKSIAFPSEMKLPLSDRRSCEYALTGVVIHVGGSSDSGHYTAYVKRPGKSKNGQWYHMDDSFVEAVSEESVLRERNAYLLFYCRKEVKLEFPPPPRRASMSAEEATEHGRARARARADSLTQLDEQNVVASAVKPKQAETTNKEVATQSRARKKGLEVLPEHATKNVRPQASKQKVEPPPVQSSSSSSSESSSGSSSGSSSDSSSSDSDGDGGRDNGNNRDRSVADKDVKQKARQVPDSTAKTTKYQDGSESSSTSNDTDSSSSSDSESEEEHTAKAPPPKKQRPLVAKKTVDSGKSTESKKKPSFTRVVMDRGRGREKVSVMVGPKFKNRKGWSPQTSGTTKSGEEYELLGNRTIDKWADSDGTSHVSHARSELVNSMEKKRRAQKRKMFPDSWDASLDRGRVKKVKQKLVDVSGSSTSGASQNSFQRILTGLQKMKHGRPKGHYGNLSTPKNKKRKR